jgi:hypothetical protein
MKKIIKLTEEGLTRLIRRVITESSEMESQITDLRSNFQKTKDGPCWKQGMCPKTTTSGVSDGCQPCPGAVAGILIPSVGAIATAIAIASSNIKDRKKEKREEEWVKNNAELANRTFLYFKDGSVQAIHNDIVRKNGDIMILSDIKTGSWTKLSK